ncbi:hypothetical protein [Gemmata sp. SH-PL17]|uniref:hypothetical protein n=1 Tax=Gemmata sp. SH-PL17 TaxID=1630693 RepID=UPI0012F8444A|nr:hypothetical protein [Gemmata sp. SH-PL17]
MTLAQAQHLLAELVRLKSDVERYQRAMGALGSVPEVRTSAHDKIANLAYHAHRSYASLEYRLARMLSGQTHDPCSSAPSIPSAPGATMPRI